MHVDLVIDHDFSQLTVTRKRRGLVKSPSGVKQVSLITRALNITYAIKWPGNTEDFAILRSPRRLSVTIAREKTAASAGGPSFLTNDEHGLP